MTIREIKEGIYSVGAIDWDRRLFDELIPLPDGTSYNSYFVVGSEKIALIDTVDPEKSNKLFANLASLDVEKIDYIIANHAEQDHSGSIPELLELYPEAQVVTNAKCKKMLVDLLQIPEGRFITVADGDRLSLGDKTLQFIEVPWVHWPETMATYLIEDQVLFSCDFFGSHLATSSLYVRDQARVATAAKRYFAEIMMPFAGVIKKNLARVRELEIDVIAPSHGPLHDQPDFILNLYEEWVSGKVNNVVVVPYVSMHGSTAAMVEHFIDALMERGVTVKPFNLTSSDIGELAMSLVDAATVVIASPTVLVGPHPQAVYGAYLANALRPPTKYISVLGSYGWGGKMVDQLKETLSNLKADLIEPAVIKGYPGDEQYQELEGLADRILEKHRELGIVE
ncbi:MAG: FprA family A-type flavoprotein [Halanaerobium sp.]|nr:FprA family A-type flavoprotein [Halanaerobium sp.]